MLFSPEIVLAEGYFHQFGIILTTAQRCQGGEELILECPYTLDTISV